jgi:hypothetical protein
MKITNNHPYVVYPAHDEPSILELIIIFLLALPIAVCAIFFAWLASL